MPRACIRYAPSLQPATNAQAGPSNYSLGSSDESISFNPIWRPIPMSRLLIVHAVLLCTSLHRSQQFLGNIVDGSVEDIGRILESGAL